MRIGTSLEGIIGRTLEPGATLKALAASVIEVTRQHRLDFVELPLDALTLYPRLFTPGSLVRLRRMAREHGFALSVHLPYLWVDLSSLVEETRRASVRAVRRAVQRAEALEPLGYVLHLTGRESEVLAASPGGVPFLERLVTQGERSLEELLPSREPAKLFLENTERAPFSWVPPLARRYGCSLCLDVGHLALQGGDPIAFLEANLPLIREVHLHDVVPSPQGRLRDHQPLGSGLLDIAGILRLLREGDYQGLLLLELMQREHLEASLEALAPMLEFS